MSLPLALTEVERARRYRERHPNAASEICKRWRTKNHQMTFGNKYVYFKENPRKGQCLSCKRKIGQEIKRTNMHHELGYFAIFPWFGVEELCVNCHGETHRNPMTGRFC